MPVTYENLALEGGGTKGHIYIGAALELEKLGVLDGLQSIAGASVGAVAALLLATGWKVEKIQNLYSSLNFKAMAEGGWWDTAKVPYNLHYNYGAYEGAAFLQLFRRVIEEVTRDGDKPGNPNATFEEWHKLKLEKPELKLKDLFVEACNHDTGYNETFSYLSQHKDVPIAEAVFASMKFPGFFTMHMIKGHRYFDGGTQRNCPSEVFEKARGEYDPKTLTIRLDNQSEIDYYEKGIIPPAKPATNVFQALMNVISAATRVQDYAFQFSRYKEHTIFASTLDAGTLDFNMPVKLQEQLRDSGRYSVKSYFHKNHPEITRGQYDTTFLEQLVNTGYPATISAFEQAVLQTKKSKVAARSTSLSSTSAAGTSLLPNQSSAYMPLHDMKVAAASTQAANTPTNTPSNSPPNAKLRVKSSKRQTVSK